MKGNIKEMIVPTNTKTKHPYAYNFIKISYPEKGDRKDQFRDRLAFYMNKYNLSAKRFADISQELAGKNGFCVTEHDINNYLYLGVSPKIDKLVAISRVMGVGIDYFCGYGKKNRKTRNPIMESRCKKHK